MNRTHQDTDDHSFLFQVDILVNAKTNGTALEHLLSVLNKGEFADYRIGTGIMLGQVIEETLKREKNLVKTSPAAIPFKTTATAAASNKASSATKAASSPPVDELDERIKHYIDTNKLIRLNVNKGRGVKLSIPCRILRFDTVGQLLTVYHVDEKQVHSFKLFEIDDFLE